MGEQQHRGILIVVVGEAHPRRILEQGRADRRGERRSGEQVAVAGHEEDRGAAVGKRADGLGDARIEWRREVVVARPVFEQVTEDEDARRLPRRLLQEGEEGGDVGGLVLAQVQVGNEQCRKRRACGFRHQRGAAAVGGRDAAVRQLRRAR